MYKHRKRIELIVQDRIIDGPDVIVINDSVDGEQVVLRRGGYSLPKDTLVFRMQVCRIFLICGLGMSLLQSNDNVLREMLESLGKATLPMTEVSKFIPILLNEEKKVVEGEIGDMEFSFSFDGTTEVAELFCVTVRFISKKTMAICHRVLSFKLLAKSMNAEEVAAHLVEVCNCVCLMWMCVKCVCM